MADKQTLIGIKLIRLLAREGYRLFDLSTARLYASKINLSHGYLPQALTYLKNNQYIYTIRNGLYALDIAFLGGIPIHEHEIAMFLISPATISHYTAFQYHGLTDQVPFVVHISTLRENKLPRLSNKTALGFEIKGTTYNFIKYHPSHYFGFVHRWEGSSKITYTDYERTLLDGLSHPHFCGGIEEVLHAFEHSLSNINMDQLISYALLLERATAKRVGWVLDHLGVDPKIYGPLLNLPVKSFNKLNAYGEEYGLYNRKWMIRENV